MSRNDLYYILRQIPAYIKKIHNPPHRFERRPVEVSGSDLWWAADLGFFTGHKDIFLVAIDVFNLTLRVEVIANKLPGTIIKALEKMFRQNDGVVPKKLETDNGTDFNSKEMTKFYAKHNIYHLVKYGKNKAFYAENAVGRIKARVHAAQASDKNAPPLPELIKQAVQILNQTPSKRLGGLKPGEIDHRYDDPKVRSLRDAVRPKLASLTWRQRKKNQAAYEKNTRNPYQEGALVYHIKPARLSFQKKDEKVGALYRIRQVRAETLPVLFKLETLQGKLVPQLYYRKELQFANIKTNERIYEVEKIIDKAKYKGRLRYLVKYFHHKKHYVSNIFFYSLPLPFRFPNVPIYKA